MNIYPECRGGNATAQRALAAQPILAVLVRAKRIAPLYIAMLPAGMRSQTRQNSRISTGVPSETRMYFSIAGIGEATSTLFFSRWGRTSLTGRSGFRSTKLACESMARSMRAFT
jgi:hypothetical protein